MSLGGSLAQPTSIFVPVVYQISGYTSDLLPVN